MKHWQENILENWDVILAFIFAPFMWFFSGYLAEWFNGSSNYSSYYIKIFFALSLIFWCIVIYRSFIEKTLRYRFKIIIGYFIFLFFMWLLSLGGVFT